MVTTQFLESHRMVTSFLIIVLPYLRISLSTGSIFVFPVQVIQLAGMLDRIFLSAASVSFMLRNHNDGSNESSSPIHSKYALRGCQLRLPAIALNPASAYEIPPQVTAGWLSFQHIEDRTFTYTIIKLLRFSLWQNRF